MKRIYLAVSVLASVLVSGCAEESDVLLNFSDGQKLSITLPSTSSSEIIEFTTNASWTASSDVDWLEVSPNQGDGGKHSITVSASANEDTEAREGLITIKAQDQQQTVTVKQSGFEGFEISQYEFNVAGKGGLVSIPVSANVDYSVEVDGKCSSWISVVKTKSMNDCTIEINVSKNPTSEERSGELTVKYESVSQTITVNQGRGILDFDPEFAKYLQQEYYVKDSETIWYDEVKDIHILEITNSDLTSLKGIEYFKSLAFLKCNDNKLTSLDVSGCEELQALHCYSNKLASLDISGCEELQVLHCYSNRLTSLDVSDCKALTELYCSSNQLAELNVTGCENLAVLECFGNFFTSLDVSGCKALTNLNCSLNRLTELALGECALLACLDCSYNKLVSVDISGCAESLIYLYCSGNKLTSLNVGNCPNLQVLYCQENLLTSLDISSCEDLTHLSCSVNKLTSLNVSSCPNLQILDCYENLLTSLDISSCSGLTVFWCDSNPGEDGRFVVKSWFDNQEIPDGFTSDGWIDYGSNESVELIYQDVVN